MPFVSVEIHKDQSIWSYYKVTQENWMSAAIGNISCRNQRTIVFGTSDRYCSYELVIASDHSEFTNAG
jgi:hypothetical protein